MAGREGGGRFVIESGGKTVEVATAAGVGVGVTVGGNVGRGVDSGVSAVAVGGGESGYASWVAVGKGVLGDGGVWLAVGCVAEIGAGCGAISHAITNSNKHSNSGAIRFIVTLWKSLREARRPFHG